MIILASGSAERARLLAGAGVEFTVVRPDVDEAEVKDELLARGAGPAEIAQALAEAKALSVKAEPEDLIVGADQTLDLAGMLLNKPRAMAEARQHLETMRGRSHVLHSACAVARGGSVVWRGLSSPIMRVRAFSPSFLDAYLASAGESVLTSCGCYQLEGLGAQLFDSVEGDYFAVLGLPLIELLAALRGAGGVLT